MRGIIRLRRVNPERKGELLNGDFREPIPDSNGLFEPVIGSAPGSWPWALPHFYAVNAAPIPEQFPQRTIGRLEIIGFWKGRFHVVHSESNDDQEGSRRRARDTFDSLPVRLLMDRGRVKEENTSVQITGTWPETWSIFRIQDLGVLCAFLHDSAVNGGAGERAERFRGLVYFAFPATEQLLVYQNALTQGRALLGPFLSEQAQAALQQGLKMAKKWLR